MSTVAERIAAFSALTFSRAHCGNLRDVVAPPYDLIDAARQTQLYARNPYNVVRLELNRDEDPYTAAAETLALWRRDAIVERASHPAIYLYTQRFHLGHTLKINAAPINRWHVMPGAHGSLESRL